MSRIVVAVFIVFQFAVIAGACGDPCDEAFTGADFCSALRTSIEAKCGPGTLPASCDEMMKSMTKNQCNGGQKYCKTDGQACLDNISAAADCDAALAVTCTHTCF
jgi:hypothetical protein